MPINNYTYTPETAADFFAELSAAMRLLPDIAGVYSAFNRVFRKCIDRNTEAVSATLCGAFAKTDYLLKEHKAARSMARDINDTRVRLRKRGDMTADTLHAHCLQDLENLCRFISLLYNTPVPDDLRRLLPQHTDTEKTDDNTAGHTELPDCIRMIVERWDDEYVYGHADEPCGHDPLKVCYADTPTPSGYNWAYLRNLLGEGTQLNLVRPHCKEDIIVPELIIYEPDYLIDISAVSRCFTNYAESPLVNLISRLRPQQSTEHTILGNFAGQLLDETVVSCRPESPQNLQPTTSTPKPYADSVKDFFKTHAVELLTVGIAPEFHKNAKAQQKNISQSISNDLPGMVSRFNPTEGMVEPSFFSEMLGLQGRMDYLQLDFRVLLEQKSGKGDFPYEGFVVPRHKEEHYVQLLLYMLLIRYNYRDIYEQNNRELHAFLLYSRYSSSLLGLGFAPDLVFRAIRLRNELAWSEMQYTREGTFRRVLDTLTPERMNMKNVSNTLWEQYQKRQIAETLAPIHSATPLEKAYYYRFLTFIANEHIMSKLGNKTKENSGFASTWHDSPEEKRIAGNIYDNLTLLYPDATTDGSIATVTLQFHENAAGDMSNFRVGDVVILYPYAPGSEPDARRTMVFRSSIEKIQADNISLRLRAVQSDSRVFVRYSGKLWAIEHDFIEASYGSLYRGMHSFLSAPKARRDLLLLQREPEVDDTVTALRGDYGEFNDMALRVKRAKELFLIIGPPGTGKTSFGMLNTVKEELAEPASSVLLLSYTNRAVDEICSKLKAEGIDFIRVGNTLNCAPEYRDSLLSERACRCDNITELRRQTAEARVYVGTTTAFNSHIALLSLRQFSLAVIDEASQILEPHLIGLLSAHCNGVPAIRKTVLIGDHKQLPAVVQQSPDVSRVTDKQLNDILLTDCRLSLFERLLRRYRNDESVTFMLCRQGRMHHDIALFPNQAFYAGMLTEVPLPHQVAGLPETADSDSGIDRILRSHRMAFIAADAPEDSPSDKVNQIEADMIAVTVKRIHDMEGDNFRPAETVGVIVPYRNQIAAIRSALDGYGIPALRAITIDTVERYQGSQRRYIIYGFTVSKYYQLKFLSDNVFMDSDGSVVDRKLNVAMTRAKEHLLIFGNPRLLARNHTFSRLIEFAKEHGCYFEDRKLFLQC